MSSVRRALPALVAVVALAAGCVDSTSGSKTGGPLPARTLVFANNDQLGLRGAPAVARFVDQVATLSDGRLVLDVRSSWSGGDDEANVVLDVGAGEADLGWAGSRVFGDLGVDSLRALSAPFLVDSYPLLTAVLEDGQARLLEEVEAGAGVAPLAVLADSLRYPVSIQGPLRGPADWKGLAMRTVPSSDQEQAFSDLGARPVSGGGFSDGLDDGTIDGGEIGWEGFVTLHIVDRAPFITANEPLWPRTDVLVADPDMLDGLSDEERQWLTDAASDALAWSLEHADEQAEEFRAEACRLGARVVLAAESDQEAMRRLASATLDRLRSDEAVAETLMWIEGLKADLPAPVAPATPTWCRWMASDAPPPSLAPLRAPGPVGALPQGTYRYRLTPDQLVERGVDETDAALNAGLSTMTFRDGEWTLLWTGATSTSECAGLYAVDGTMVQFTRTQDQANGDCVPPGWTAEWAMDGDELVWSNLVAYPPAFQDFAPWFVDVPWKKIA